MYSNIRNIMNGYPGGARQVKMYRGPDPKNIHYQYKTRYQDNSGKIPDNSLTKPPAQRGNYQAEINISTISSYNKGIPVYKKNAIIILHEKDMCIPEKIEYAVE
jgi:hypothetical protein